MRRTVAAIGVAAVGLAIGGCANTKASGFGSRGAPNEFAVTRAAPLTVPPDFALRPPKPGAPRPQEASPATQALAAMFGGTRTASPGEDALVDAAGGNPESGVRSEARGGAAEVVDKGTTTQTILKAAPGAQPAATASTPQR